MEQINCVNSFPCCFKFYCVLVFINSFNTLLIKKIFYSSIPFSYTFKLWPLIGASRSSVFVIYVPKFIDISTFPCLNPKISDIISPQTYTTFAIYILLNVNLQHRIGFAESYHLIRTVNSFLVWLHFSLSSANESKQEVECR